MVLPMVLRSPKPRSNPIGVPVHTLMRILRLSPETT